MRITENAIMAIKNLRSNKMRSFLTMLGIIIGVGAVITMVSLGEGAKSQITKEISAMGSNLIIVSPGRNSEDSINNNTIELVEAASEYIQMIAPAARDMKTAEVRGQSLKTFIVGCTPEYALVRNYKVEYGNFISAADCSTRRRVAVIGSYVANELFPGVNPIGEELKVGGVRLEVIGVLKGKGENGSGNGDNSILVPLATAQERIFGSKNLSEINVQVQSEAYVDYTYERINQTLSEELDDDDEFNLSNMADLLAAAQEMTKIMTLLLAGIAAVSLLVGGIGIMNIMLVSVTERIREIGIRKAIGAQPEEILLLFLIEAITLSLIGGTIGIIWGSGMALVIGKAIGWTITISGTAVTLAFAFSMAVGLFFGVFPAYKASGLNPIEALRHE